MKVKHYDNDGRARFVTFSINKRLPILTNDHFRNIIFQEICYICQEYQLRLLAFVIMPEHIHLVMVPPDNCEVGNVIGELKRRSAVQILGALRNNKSPLLEKLMIVHGMRKRIALWMPRCFDHNCRTDESVWEKVRYCHNNPVKRGLVTKPESWRWSSYSLYKKIEVLQEIDLTFVM